jgi:hypothetical protein
MGGSERPVLRGCSGVFLVQNVTPNLAHLLPPSETLADSADETEQSELVEVTGWVKCELVHEPCLAP